MTDLSQVSTEELQRELARRGRTETCPTCRKWPTYLGAYDHDGYTTRCHGCLRTPARCTCR